MFTGIVTEIGEIKKISKKGSSLRLGIKCESVQEGLNVGDSIAVNGACLSITEMGSILFFDVIGNTAQKTNLKRLKPGNKVNLEGALKLGDTLSGHMVSGHIDGERLIKGSRKSAKGWVLDIEMIREDEKYVIPKGSVSIDGVSLTIGEVLSGYFRMFLIPHTLDNTIIKDKKTGDHVNVEFDMMAKYSRKQQSSGSITMDKLSQKGFI